MHIISAQEVLHICLFKKKKIEVVYTKTPMKEYLGH